MTEKQNPPDGMAMAYRWGGSPYVWVDGEYHNGGNFDSGLVVSKGTPIHPLDPADPQPWAIAPEVDSNGDGTLEAWKTWSVHEDESHFDQTLTLDRAVEYMWPRGQQLRAIYKRHTIHGVDLLERVYLRGEPKGDGVTDDTAALQEQSDRGHAREPPPAIKAPNATNHVPAVSDVNWNPDPWARPPERVQVPERSWAGTRIGGKFSVTLRGNPVVVDQPPADDIAARYDITGHLIGYRGPDGEWVETKPEKLGRWESDGYVADLDARTMKAPWGETYRLNSGWNEEYLRMVLAGETQWTRIPDDEPKPQQAKSETSPGQSPMLNGQKDRAGERPAPICPWCSGEVDVVTLVCVECRHAMESCPECSNRGTTGMGPCSLCAPEPKPEPPPAILRKLRNPWRLSLRLESLSPERSIALKQCQGAAEIAHTRPLHGAVRGLWHALRNHYPRTRHIRAIEDAFTEYVKSQEDVPKKPEADAQEQENTQ